MRITKIGQLKDGMKIKGSICGHDVPVAEVKISDGKLHFLSNSRSLDGGHSGSRRGWLYSWFHSSCMVQSDMNTMNIELVQKPKSKKAPKPTEAWIVCAGSTVYDLSAERIDGEELSDIKQLIKDLQKEVRTFNRLKGLCGAFED